MVLGNWCWFVCLQLLHVQLLMKSGGLTVSAQTVCTGLRFGTIIAVMGLAGDLQY